MSFLSDFNNYGHHVPSVDFASLPPSVNMYASLPDKEHGFEKNNFRLSESCLSEDKKTDLMDSSVNIENKNLLPVLIEQVKLLHETNTKMCRNLQEAKVDIETLKRTPGWGLKYRRDSISGLSTHSQPMIFGNGSFNQSQGSTYHSGTYTPGLMTDTVREIKEAARIREDALLNRVKSMVDERHWLANESNIRLIKDIEELKIHIQDLQSNRKDVTERIIYLEAENKYLRQLLDTLVSRSNMQANVRCDNGVSSTRKDYPESSFQYKEKLSMTHIKSPLSVSIPIIDTLPDFDNREEKIHKSSITPPQCHADRRIGKVISPPNFTLVSKAESNKKYFGKVQQNSDRNLTDIRQFFHNKNNANTQTSVKETLISHKDIYDKIIE